MGKIYSSFHAIDYVMFTSLILIAYMMFFDDLKDVYLTFVNTTLYFNWSLYVKNIILFS